VQVVGAQVHDRDPGVGVRAGGRVVTIDHAGIRLLLGDQVERDRLRGQGGEHSDEGDGDGAELHDLLYDVCSSVRRHRSTQRTPTARPARPMMNPRTTCAVCSQFWCGYAAARANAACPRATR